MQSWRALPDPVRLFHGKLAAAEGGSQRFDVAFAELSQVRIADDAAKRYPAQMPGRRQPSAAGGAQRVGTDYGENRRLPGHGAESGAELRQQAGAFWRL